MKKFIILIQILITSFSYSQTNLKGKFCNSFNGGFSSVCIEFKENMKFEYSTHGCLGIEDIGHGNFSLKSNKVVLNFDKVETKQKSKIKTDLIAEERKDSITLNFKILDGHNNKLPMPARILIESNSFEYEKGIQVDNSGEVTISKERNSDNEKYRILFIGYERFEFELSNSSSKNIEITLEPAGPRIISDKILEYKIEKKNKDSITLKDGTKFIRLES